MQQDSPHVDEQVRVCNTHLMKIAYGTQLIFHDLLCKEKDKNGKQKGQGLNSYLQGEKVRMRQDKEMAKWGTQSFSPRLR